MLFAFYRSCAYCNTVRHYETKEGVRKRMTMYGDKKIVWYLTKIWEGNVQDNSASVESPCRMSAQLQTSAADIRILVVSWIHWNPSIA